MLELIIGALIRRAPNSAQGTTQSTLRFLRLLYGILLFSMVLYAIIAERLAHRNQTVLNGFFPWYFAAISLVQLGIVVWARIYFIRPALERLQLKPDDNASLQRWRMGAILSAVLLESIVLFGFVLRFLGGTFAQSLPFYAVAVALMLVFWPQEP